MVTAALGWMGMAGTFGAYVLLARGRLSADSICYSLLNAGGGLLGGVASALYGAWPSATSNLVWAAFGLHGVLVALREPPLVEPTPLVSSAPAEPAPLPQAEYAA